MAAKQYVVRIPFDRVDRRTGVSKRYEPGDPYTGDDAELYLAGVDDQGPPIVEKPSGGAASTPSSKEN